MTLPPRPRLPAGKALLLLVLAAALGGCSGVGPTRAPGTGSGAGSGAGATSTAAAGLSPEQRAGLPTALAIERQWLLSWFKGSPVAIAQRADGAVTVDVPRQYCFDPGQNRIKPPLAAVLDKVAESLRRRPLVHLALAAPGDGRADVALGRDRAAQIQRYLRARGIGAERLEPPTVAEAAVQLRLQAPPG